MKEMRVIKSIEWNTGRMYGPKGQPIKAFLIDAEGDKLVYFTDSTRMIDGLLPVYSSYTLEDSYALERWVQVAYDMNQYTCRLYASEVGVFNVTDVRRFLVEQGML